MDLEEVQSEACERKRGRGLRVVEGGRGVSELQLV